MTNTRNTLAEGLEQEYPLWIENYAFREDSNGQGEFPGGRFPSGHPNPGGGGWATKKKEA